MNSTEREYIDLRRGLADKIWVHIREHANSLDREINTAAIDQILEHTVRAAQVRVVGLEKQIRTCKADLREARRETARNKRLLSERIAEDKAVAREDKAAAKKAKAEGKAAAKKARASKRAAKSSSSSTSTSKSKTTRSRSTLQMLIESRKP